MVRGLELSMGGPAGAGRQGGGYWLSSDLTDVQCTKHLQPHFTTVLACDAMEYSFIPFHFISLWELGQNKGVVFVT